MTGLGERSHLLNKDINVSTHVTDIVNVIRWEDLSDVVLVGHSYGGAVITEAGNDPKVQRLHDPSNWRDRCPRCGRAP